ncbi:MAG: S-layer homology domain-containing protein, partial [Clostridia bacterium]
NGYPDGTFRPDAKITRAEIAQIFYNAFGWSDLVKHFDDVQPSAWYYDAITALATVGLVNGYPDNTFLPNNNARRCEVAQIIYNLISGIVIEQ